MSYKLEEIIDISLLQNFQEKLYNLYSLPSAIFDADGKKLTAVLSQEVCYKFHRTHPEASKECIKCNNYIKDNLHLAKPTLNYNCSLGLIENATPLIIDGNHLGNFFVGQFMHEAPDLVFFEKQAEIYGFNKKEYLEAVNKIPIITKEKLEFYLDFIKGFIEIVKELAIKNIKEIETNTAFKENKSFLESIFTSMSDMLFVFDINGNFIEYNNPDDNPELYAPAELFLNKHYSEILPLNISNKIKYAIELIKENGNAQQFDYSMNINNNTNWYNAKLSMLKDKNGEYAGITSLIRNITNRKLTEEKLKESEEKYKELVENSPDAIIIFKENKIVFANEKTYKLLNSKTTDIILEKNIIDFIHSDFKKLVTDNINKTNAENNILPFVEAKLLRFDESLADVEIKIIPLNIEGNKEIQIIIRDISEQKQIISQLEQAKNNFDVFFNNVDDLLFVLDTNGNIIHTNKTVIDRLEYTSEELMGKSVMMVHPIEKREEAAKIVESMLKGETNCCHIPIITKSGVLIPVETKVSFGIWNNKPAIFGVSKDVSELKLSEEKFSKIFFLNPSACGLSDLVTGQYTEVNNAFIDLFGFSKEEVIGKTPMELGILSEENRLNIINKTNEKGKGLKIETILLNKNNEPKNVLLSAENINIQNKNFRFTLVEDITEQKQAIEKLIESEETYKMLFNSINDAIFISELSEETNTTKFIRVNEIACQRLGYTREELLKLTTYDINSELTRPSLAETVIKIKEKKHAIIESEHVTKDGRIIPVEISVNVTQLNGKTYFHSIARDITNRKLAEKEIIENEEKLRNIFNNLQDAYFQADINGRFTSVSPSAIKMYGYESIEEMIGLSAVDLYADPNTRIVLFNILKENKKVVDYIGEGKRKNGEIFWVSMNVQFNYDKNGEICGTTGVVRDFTERKLVEDKLINTNRLYAVLSKTNQAIVNVKSKQQLYKEVCDIIIEDGKFRMVWIGEIDDTINKVLPVHSAGYVNGYLDNLNIDLNDELLSSGPSGIAAKTGAYYIASNIAENPEMKPWREKALKNGYYTSAAFPIKVFDKVISLFTLYSDKSYFFNEEEINLILMLTENISNAIEYLELNEIKKQTTKALKESEETYRMLFNSINDAIFISELSEDGKSTKFIQVNEVACKSLGYTKEELLAKTTFEINSEEAKPKVVKHMQDIMVKKHALIETEHVTKDGKVLPVEISVNVTELNGKVYFHSIARDITERKKAELLLNEIIQQNPLSIQIVDLNGYTLKTNPAHTLLFGAVPPPDFSIFDDLEQRGLSETIKRAKKGETLHLEDLYYNVHDIDPSYPDNPVWIRAVIFPLKDNNGNFESFAFMHENITEQKLAEEKLREKDKEFRKLSANVPDLIFQFTKRPDGNYCVPIASEGIINIFGCKPEDVVDDFEPIGSVIHPDDAERVINDIEYSAKHLTYFTCEFRVQIPGKDVQWIYSNSSPEKLADGSITWYGFNADITKRKLIEEGIKEKEVQYRNLANSGSALIWTSNTEKLCTYFNDPWLKFTGRTMEQEYGNGWAEGVHPDDFDNCLEIYVTSFDKQEAFEMEYRLRHHSGEYKWLIDMGTPNYNSVGEFIGYIGHCFDITERKLIEEKLIESESRFRDLMHEVQSVSIQGYSPDGTTQYWNRASELLYGYSAEEAIGKNLVDLIIPSDMKEYVKEAIKHMADTGEAIPSSELLLHRKDGSRIPVFSSHTIIKKKDQNQELFCIDIDLTERKKAEEELKEKMHDLERFQKLTVGRELTMIELKKEVNALLKKNGQNEKYKIVE